MRPSRIILLFTIAAVALASCTTFKATGLAVSPAEQKYAVLGNFSIQIPVTEFLGSSGGSKLLNVTANATDPAIAAAIQQEIKAKGGTGAVNVTIVHKASFFNLLLNGLTLGIYAPGTVEVSGIVVK